MSSMKTRLTGPSAYAGCGIVGRDIATAKGMVPMITEPFSPARQVALLQSLDDRLAEISPDYVTVLRNDHDGPFAVLIVHRRDKPKCAPMKITVKADGWYRLIYGVLDRSAALDDDEMEHIVRMIMLVLARPTDTLPE